MASGSTSIQVGKALVDGETYYVYVQVKQNPTQASAWAYSTFTTLFAPPGKPVITAVAAKTATTGYPVVKLTVTCHTNVLTTTSAGFDVGVGKWTAGTNTTVGREAVPISRPNVTGCMVLTPGAAGTLKASTTPATAFPVVGGQVYAIRATFAAEVSSRTCHLVAKWINATGGVISTITVSATADSTTAWATIAGVETAPTAARYCQLTLRVATVSGATDVHYVTAVGVNPAAVVTWLPGGYIGVSKIEVKRSDGLYVRGASTLNPHPVTVTGGIQNTTTIYDFEAIPSTEYHYTARVVVPTLNQISPTSTATGTVEVTATAWWMIDPTTTATAVSVNPISWNPVQTEQSAAHMVMTRPTMNVIASAMMHQDFQGTFWTNTATIYGRFQALLTSQKTVLILSSIAPTTDSGYFRVGPQTGGLSSGVGNKSKTTQLQASTRTAPVRTIGITAVAQTRPPV